MKKLPLKCYNNPCSSLSEFGYCCSLCGLNKSGGFDSLTDTEKSNYCFWSALPSADGELSHCLTSPSTNICPISSIYDTNVNQTTMPDCSRVSAGANESQFKNCYSWYNEARGDVNKQSLIDKQIDGYCSFKRNQQFVEQSTNMNVNTSGPYNDCLCWAAMKGYDKEYNELVRSIGSDVMDQMNISCFWPPCQSKDQLIPTSVNQSSSCSTVCQKILDVINKKKLDVKPEFKNYLEGCSEISSSFSLYLSIFIILFVIIIVVVLFVVSYYYG